MEIKFLKAGKGDAILVSSNGEHMLVDGGDDTTYLFKELDVIYNKGESINCLVVTHHDSDHINGILELFKELNNNRYGVAKDFIKRIYFNSPRLFLGKKISTGSNQLSYKQAYQLEEKICELDILWDQLLTEKSNIFNIGSFSVNCLSPTDDIVDSYSNNSGAYLSSLSEGDWGKSLEDLSKYVSDKKLDKSPPNESSIVLEVESDNFRTLLTADITPKRLAQVLSDLFNRNDNKLLQYNFFKLPHHGCHRNITKEILSKIACDKYFISTDGNNHYLPNKKTILKVLDGRIKPEGTTEFYFNYQGVIDKLQITEVETKKGKFELIGNNKDYGYCFSAI